MDNLSTTSSVELLNLLYDALESEEKELVDEYIDELVYRIYVLECYSIEEQRVYKK